MALLQGLQRTALKHASAPAPPAARAHDDIVGREHELNRRMRESDLDAWYDALKEHTYKSAFVPLTPEEAEAMVQIYEARRRKESDPAQGKALLTALEARLDAAMVSLGAQAVFAKLSSRSPKDATNRVPIKYHLLAQLLAEKSRVVGGRALTPNEILGCVFQAHISSFELTTAKEVLETLLSSDRCASDELPLVLEHKAHGWKEHIVLREWVDVPIAFEFRGFVFGDRLTALCQYYDEVCYPELVANRAVIEHLVNSFFEHVRALVPITPKEYVMDFVVDVPRGLVRIVEINPFGEPDAMGTGTVMFNLTQAHDADVLFGRAPFEFRLEEKELEESKYATMLAPEMKSIVRPYERKPA